MPPFRIQPPPPHMEGGKAASSAVSPSLVPAEPRLVYCSALVPRGAVQAAVQAQWVPYVIPVCQGTSVCDSVPWFKTASALGVGASGTTEGKGHCRRTTKQGGSGWGHCGASGRGNRSTKAEDLGWPANIPSSEEHTTPNLRHHGAHVMVVMPPLRIQPPNTYLAPSAPSPAPCRSHHTCTTCHMHNLPAHTPRHASPRSVHSDSAAAHSRKT